MPFRSSASRNGPFGLCLAEAFGNSLADSVSFRFPSRQSLDGHPVPPANSAQGMPPLPVNRQLIKKTERRQAATSLSPLTLRHVPWATPTVIACKPKMSLFSSLVFVQTQSSLLTRARKQSSQIAIPLSPFFLPQEEHSLISSPSNVAPQSKQTYKGPCSAYSRSTRVSCSQ